MNHGFYLKYNFCICVYICRRQQLRKNVPGGAGPGPGPILNHHGEVGAGGISPTTGGYHDFHPNAVEHPSSAVNTASTIPSPLAMFPGSNGRSFKKMTGPPLPPANHHLHQQFPLLKKPHAQHPAQPEIICPAKSIGAGGGGAGPIGRNISAMLDENNTVRCYLEPLNK